MIVDRVFFAFVLSAVGTHAGAVQQRLIWPDISAETELYANQPASVEFCFSGYVRNDTQKWTLNLEQSSFFGAKYDLKADFKPTTDHCYEAEFTVPAKAKTAHNYRFRLDRSRAWWFNRNYEPSKLFSVVSVKDAERVNFDAKETFPVKKSNAPFADESIDKVADSDLIEAFQPEDDGEVLIDEQPEDNGDAVDEQPEEALFNSQDEIEKVADDSETEQIVAADNEPMMVFYNPDIWKRKRLEGLAAAVRARDPREHHFWTVIKDPIAGLDYALRVGDVEAITKILGTHAIEWTPELIEHYHLLEMAVTDARLLRLILSTFLFLFNSRFWSLCCRGYS